MNAKAHCPIISFAAARGLRQERELERISEAYVMQDELLKAIEALEILLKLREERTFIAQGKTSLQRRNIRSSSV